MSFQKILIALDHSPQADQVFEKALAIATCHHSELLIVHSLIEQPSGESGPFLGIGTIGDVNLYGNLQHRHREQLHQELENQKNWLQTYCQQAIAQGLSAECNCQVGEAGAKICELAQNWGADLIVVGRRGRGGLTEMMLGSVSNHVVHHASCAALIIQGQSNEAAQSRSVSR